MGIRNFNAVRVQQQKNSGKNVYTLKDIEILITGKKVGIDIDGVCVDFARDCFLPALNEMLGTNYKIEQVKDWDWSTSLGISKEDVSRCWHSRELTKYLRIAPPIPGMKELLNKVSSDSVYITTRGASTPKFHLTITRKWLATNGFPDFPIRSVRKKREAVEQSGIEFMIEDGPKNIMELADVPIKILVPRYDYNEQHLEQDNVIPFDF